MKQKIERIILLAALTIGLSCAWFAPLDNHATQVVDAGLKRALLTFGSARALHMALSMVESVSFGVVTIGKAVTSFNDVVKQFADVMLAVCVAFGAMKLIIVIGGTKGVSLLLSLVALWWSWLRWQEIARPLLLSTMLMALVLIRFAVPVVSIGSEAVFQQLLATNYHTAQSGITDFPSIGLSESNVAPEKKGNEAEVLQSIKNWWGTVKDIPARLEIEQTFEKKVQHIIDLIVLFLLQTVVVPLLLFWILYRIVSAMLNPARQSN